MKKRLVRVAAMVALLLVGSLSALAESHIRITVEGNKQGKFKAEGAAKGETAVLRYEYAMTSPRDASTGKATGKAQHSPVTITKQIGISTPQFYEACVNNETLKSVLIEFFETGPSGKEYVYYSVRLTNAAVSRIFQYTDIPPTAGQPPQNLDLEDISFTFQKIEISTNDNNTAGSGKVSGSGKTTATDDWIQ
jgi:type VI secretion system secreted protein Hcp